MSRTIVNINAIKYDFIYNANIFPSISLLSELCSPFVACCMSSYYANRPFRIINSIFHLYFLLKIHTDFFSLNLDIGFYGKPVRLSIQFCLFTDANLPTDQIILTLK